MIQQLAHPLIHSTLKDAVAILSKLQAEAAESGTYAVSGVLIDKKGRIIYQQKNRVLVPLRCGKTFLLDPTNHAERQMVSWYWKHRQALMLPDPSVLTIITTLDPCLMCAMCILGSGFNVGVISLDPHGGVGFGLDSFAAFDFAPGLRKALQNSFGYYKIEGSPIRKDYLYSASQVVFKDEMISKQTEEQLRETFKKSSVTVGRHKQTIGLHPHKLLNLRGLQREHEIINSLKVMDKNALTITLTQPIAGEGGHHCHHYEPTPELKEMLEELVKSTPSAKNAVALIDPHGNLLLARADRFDLSPIDAAIYRLITEYSDFRFKLISQVSLSGRVIEESPAFNYLSIMEYCSFVFLNSMPGDDLISLLNVGLYAVAIKRDTTQSRFIYINDYETLERPTLQEIISKLPPAYGDKHKHIRPIQAKIGKKNKE